MSWPEKQPVVYLLDSNILLRLAQTEHPMNPIAQTAVENIASNGDEMVIVAQTLWEFFVVATRPRIAREGFGWTITQAQSSMDEFRATFPLCEEKPLFKEWERLVTPYNTIGTPAHDARFVAAMKAHRITHLLTFNTRDFNRYVTEGITIVDPSGVPAAAAESGA